jgi:hypothetical protein
VLSNNRLNRPISLCFDQPCSTSAFTKIATQSDGRVPISWEFISCFEAGLEKPSTESFAWKSGSSAYWVRRFLSRSLLSSCTFQSPFSFSRASCFDPQAGIQARHTDGNVAKLAIKINGVYTDIPRLNCLSLLPFLTSAVHLRNLPKVAILTSRVLYLLLPQTTTMSNLPASAPVPSTSGSRSTTATSPSTTTSPSTRSSVTREDLVIAHLFPLHASSSCFASAFPPLHLVGLLHSTYCIAMFPVPSFLLLLSSLILSLRTLCCSL